MRVKGKILYIYLKLNTLKQSQTREGAFLLRTELFSSRAWGRRRFVIHHFTALNLSENIGVFNAPGAAIETQAGSLRRVTSDYRTIFRQPGNANGGREDLYRRASSRSRTAPARRGTAVSTARITRQRTTLVPRSKILFNGLVYSGEVQINLVIPDDAPGGPAVPLVLSIGTANSRADATVAIK